MGYSTKLLVIVFPIPLQKIDIKSVTKLNFFKNASDDYHCPVLFKPFTKNSHIVAVRTSGNVYCYEAIEQLNIKGKNWKDLINDTPFTRSDLITIQDPNNLGKFNISLFHHIKNNLKVETEGIEVFILFFNAPWYYMLLLVANLSWLPSSL